MRITERNNPILKYLKWNKPLSEHKDMNSPRQDIFGMDKEDLIRYGEQKMGETLVPFIDNWPMYRDMFAKNIEVVSEEFLRAALSNYSKLMTEEVLRTALCGNEISGTVFCGRYAICYWIRWVDKKDGWYSSFLIHSGSMLALAEPDSNPGFAATCPDAAKSAVDASKLSYAETLKMLPMLLYLFKRYATVETVQAVPYKKVKLPDQKDTLMVDSDLNVKYIDCSWFRTIIRTEGFMVRGHFRLQPFKNEKREWDYKLIYIEPFQKHGYTRRAKKIIAQENGTD